jgi:predicted permease
MSQLWQDTQYAGRMLAKSPVVTFVGVFSLALGIGANTAIFSLINALMLRSLPVRDPQQLVALSTVRPDSLNGGLSLAMFEEIQRLQHVFSSMFAWSGGGIANFEANGVKYAAGLDTVSGDYFSTLGVQPLFGRLILPDDLALDTGFPAPVAVIDYRCWRRRYKGDPAVIGRSILVDGRLLTIVGVTPKDFMGLIIDAASDVTVPIGYSGGTTYRDRKNVGLDVMARLKREITLPQARAQLQAMWPGIQAVTLPENSDSALQAQFLARRIRVESAATGTSYMRGRLARPLAVMMGLVGLVLLVACVNIANLMLARAAGRRHELGIRLALGAGPWRLIRQLLTESLILAAVGAALGLGIAFWASRFLINTQWSGLVPLSIDPAPDLRVLAFTSAIAVLTGIIFGLAPGWGVARTDPASVLQHGVRTVRDGGGLLGKLLVSTQIALSLVLVIGAMLFVHSLAKLRSADLGFRREGILMMQMFPQAGREKIPDRAVYYRQVAEELSRLPGVKAVSYSDLGPAVAYDHKVPVLAPSSPGGPAQAADEIIGPGFFHLLGMRVIAGREFGWRDDERASRVVIISESLARRLFSNANPLGQKVDIAGQLDRKGMEIVGVVNSASLWVPQHHEPPAIYMPLLQERRRNQPMLDIRADGDSDVLARSAARTLESLGRHYSLRTETLEHRLDWTLRNERLMAKLSMFFGGLALLLASVGLYALMSYAVTRRTSEIGVRMALGAGRGDVLRLVLLEVMWLTLSGVAVGVPAALAASHLISSMLFELSANDPGTIAVSAATLSAVALFAGYLPARRASRIDPMMALRSE